MDNIHLAVDIITKVRDLDSLEESCMTAHLLLLPFWKQTSCSILH